MIDRDFEQYCEKSVALLSNAGYFARYRELIAVKTCRAAWEQVESEIPLGLRRFTSYGAFKEALRLERGRALPEIARFQMIPA